MNCQYLFCLFFLSSFSSSLLFGLQVRALPKLRVLIIGLMKSVSSIGYIAMLCLIQFYLWAVIGTSMFSRNDPVSTEVFFVNFFFSTYLKSFLLLLLNCPFILPIMCVFVMETGFFWKSAYHFTHSMEVCYSR